MRWLALALCLAGCSCEDEPELAAEGYVRCHLAPPPEGERQVGDLRLRFEGRTLTVEGLGDAAEVLVAAGPVASEVPDADVLVVLGDAPAALETDALVFAVAGGADVQADWAERFTVETRVVDATPLRLIRLGDLELVPVAGAPARYAASDGACGLAADDAAAWELEEPREGVTRVLVSWAAPEATGVLGLGAGSPVLADIRSRARAGAVAFAWPRLDPRAVRPASGPWIERHDGRRESPGWTRLDSITGAD